MKDIIILLLLLPGFSPITNAQSIDSSKVPVVVKTKLKKLYPVASGILWAFDTYFISWNHTNDSHLYSYLATFSNNNDDITLYIDSTGGRYIATENTRLEIPEFILNKFAALYPAERKARWWKGDDYDDMRNAAFVACFDDSGKNYVTGFDSAGNFTSGRITYEDSALLPPPVKQYIKKHFSRYSLTFANEYIIQDPTDETSFLVIRIHKEDPVHYYSLTFNKALKLLHKKKNRIRTTIDF